MTELDPPVHRGATERREVTLAVRMTTTALAEIDRLAVQEQRTRADMARILLNDGLRARGELVERR